MQHGKLIFCNTERRLMHKNRPRFHPTRWSFHLAQSLHKDTSCENLCSLGRRCPRGPMGTRLNELVVSGTSWTHMHANELIELAAHVAAHARTVAHGVHEMSPVGLQHYWVASKSRLDRWAGRLKQYASQGCLAADAQSMLTWQRIHTAIEEIFVSEPLTRIWAAVGVVYDQARGTNEVAPVLRSVFFGHLEARRRALNLMVYGRGFTTRDSVELNRLRRRVERWTDLLVSQVNVLSCVTEFGFDAHRVRDFSRDMQHASRTRGDFTWELTIASLRAAFSSTATGLGANRDLNERIAASVLGCLPDLNFDPASPFKSAWLLRLNQNAADSEGMIAELLALDAPSFD